LTQPSYPLYTYQTKTNTQIRDDLLRTEKNGLIALGIPNPNVGPGSDSYIRATAIGNELAVVQANNTILADQLMPDTSAGTFLDRWLNMFGLGRNPATGSAGVITIQCSAASTTIVTGQQLVDQNGLRFQVSIGGTYSNSIPVPVQALDTGAGTDHANGDVLTWVTLPPFCAQNVTVGTQGGSDGLSGGADSEVGVDEPPRARLFSFFQNTPRGGNSSDIAMWAGQSTPEVQATFVYPALQGPGTVFFCCTETAQTTGALSAASKGRSLASTIVTGTVVPFVQGLLPEHVYSVGATVLNQPTDVAIQLSLPSAPTGSPPGPGGGWVDGTPWPQSLGGTAPVTVTAYTNSTQFTVNALNPPQVGVSHVAWLSPLNWQVYSAIVTSIVPGSIPGAYQITVDTPMVGIGTTPGNILFPQSINQNTYVAALLGAFAAMGPGEWTNNALVLPRAYRHPQPQTGWPYSLGATQLKQVISSGTEVLDAAWIYRQNITPALPTSIVVNASGVLTSNPPSTLTPNNVGFYQL
jgi:uncharacterized phage protein gp47/JayE